MWIIEGPGRCVMELEKKYEEAELDSINGGETDPQLVGLPMHDLIGAPLKAIGDIHKDLLKSTNDFITNVGYDKDGNPYKQ